MRVFCLFYRDLNIPPIRIAAVVITNPAIANPCFLFFESNTPIMQRTTAGIAIKNIIPYEGITPDGHITAKTSESTNPIIPNGEAFAGGVG